MTAASRLFAIGALLGAGICAPTLGAASDLYIEQRGEITAEMSWYPRSALHAGQQDSFSHLEMRPEIFAEMNRVSLLLQPRLSGGSHGQGVADLREAHITGQLADFDILVGSTVLFWGKTESHNPVDIVNSLDYSRGLMRGEKQGAPMIRLSAPAGAGQLDMLLIDFVENRYAALPLRERPALAVSRRGSFSSGADQDDLAQALRWSGYFGDTDLGFSWFRGVGNAPRLLPQADGTLQPDYSRITQFGIDIQHLTGDTAFKGEFIRRSGQYDLNGVKQSYRAAVVGMEHNLYDLRQSGRDLVVIAEYAYDSRHSTTHSGFQNDLAIGVRLLFNDVEDSEAMLLLSRDLDNGAQLVSLTSSRRITDGLTFAAEIRLTNRIDRDPARSSLARDNAVIASLTYGF